MYRIIRELLHLIILKKCAHTVASLGTVWLIYSCAAVSSPGGGPKDQIQPILISADPKEGSLHFSGEPLDLRFSH